MKITRSIFRVPGALGLAFAVSLNGCGAALASDVSPVLKGSWPGDTMGRTWDVALSGNYAYLADGDAGLRVIDVSNAAYPKKVADYSTTSSAWAVAVSGPYAYLNEESDELGLYGLEVVDISNPAEPKHVGRYDSGDPFMKVALSGNYAYLAGANGFQVVDISQPTDPRWVGGYAGAKNFFGYLLEECVAVAGDYAYVASYTNGFLVLDVSDPTNITKVGGCEIETYSSAAPSSPKILRTVFGDSPLYWYGTRK